MHRLTMHAADVVLQRLQCALAADAAAQRVHQLHGLLLVAHGVGCPMVARWFGCHVRTVERWVQAFNATATAAADNGPAPKGRPARLSAQQCLLLHQALALQPVCSGYPHTVWTARLLRQHLQTQHDVQLGVRQCQRLLRAVARSPLAQTPGAASRQPAPRQNLSRAPVPAPAAPHCPATPARPAPHG